MKRKKRPVCLLVLLMILHTLSASALCASVDEPLPETPETAETLSEAVESLEETLPEIAEETLPETEEETFLEVTDETIPETADGPLSETADEPAAEVEEEPITGFEEEPIAEAEEEPISETEETPSPEAEETPSPEVEEEAVDESEEEPLLAEDAVIEEVVESEHIGTDANFITVRKTFTGIAQEQIPKDFAITVSGANGSYRLTKQGVEGAGGSVTHSADGLTWKWKIVGAGIGNYTVAEQNAQVEGYTLTASGDMAQITVEEARMENLTLDIYTTCSHVDWSMNGSRFFAATLTSQKGSVVITERPLSASERTAISSAIKKREKGTWKEPVHYYSFQDKHLAEGEKVTITGGVMLSYSAKDGMIYLNRTADWQHVISGSYDMRAPVSPEIEIENAYRKNTAALTVTKRVAGSMADRNRAFRFEATYETYNNGAQEQVTQTFELKDGESKTFEGIVVGSRIVIVETESGYTVEASSDAQGAQSGTAYTVEAVPENGCTVEFVNTKDAIIDTGIVRDSLPYAILLLLAGVFIAARLIGRRRK